MLLLARLDLETRAYHRAVDEPWLALLSPRVTRSQYADQLARAYGFELPLETAFEQTPFFALTLGSRARARLMSRDLFALDYQGLRSLPRRAMAPFTNLADACGWLYALERSTQLYPMVAGHLLRHLPQLANALRYLSDPTAQDRWRSLGGLFENVAHTPKTEGQIIEAARDAMATVVDWYALENEALRAGA